MASSTKTDHEAHMHQILGRVAGHWPILIVSELRHGPRRFTELLHSIEGIHQRSLSEALRKLEQDGLLTRTIVPTFPRRSDYALTPRGGTLQVATAPLVRWAAARAAELANGIDRSPVRTNAREHGHAEHGDPGTPAMADLELR